MDQLREKFQEVISSILPMTVLILVLSFILAPFDSDMMISFLGGAVMMIVGMALFLFGADLSMMEVGSRVGSFIVRKRSIVLLVLIGFIVGMFITVAEPDVQVLAGQVADVSQGAVSKGMLTAIVGVGVGIFLVLALLRIVFQVKLIYLMFGGYLLIFILAAFANPDFVPVAFDSGGVTTGPLTVPFILAMGTGITSAIRSGKGGNDSFGMVGLASLGPVLAVMILGVIYR